MNKIAGQIKKKIKNLPEVYLQEVLDFIDFMEHKIKKNKDTKYLESISGISEPIKRGRKEKIEDCKTFKDIVWRQ